MSSGRDDGDRADVAVLAVERVGVAWGAKTLSRAVRIDGGWAQDGRGEVRRLLGLRLCWRRRPGDGGLPGGNRAPGGLPWSGGFLGEHCPHQE